MISFINFRGRIAVFAIKVLRDERICVVAEQRPDCSEEEVRTFRFLVKKYFVSLLKDTSNVIFFMNCADLLSLSSFEPC